MLNLLSYRNLNQIKFKSSFASKRFGKDLNVTIFSNAILIGSKYHFDPGHF